MKSRIFIRSPYFRLSFWVAVIGILLYLALRDVRLAEVWQALKSADLGYVGLGIFSVAINIWAKAVRWQVLLGPNQEKIGFGKVLMVLLTGQTLNWFVPGRVGELSRAYVLGGMGPGRTYVLGTVAIEKVLDMVSYALLFLLLVIVLPLPQWINDSGYTFTVIAGLVLAGLVVLAGYPERFASLLDRFTFWLPERLRDLTSNRFRAGLESLKIMHRRPDLFKVAGLSVFIWATAIWTNYLTFLALGLKLSWTAAAIVLIVLQAGISVPSLPGRIGLFQYLCILSLALFGVDQAAGLSYGILLQAIVLVPPTIVSLFFFWYLGWNGVKRELTSASEQVLE